MKKILFLIILSAAIACSPNKESSEDAKASENTLVTENVAVDVAVSAITNYINVKDALVASDVKAATENAMTLVESARQEGLSEEIINAAQAVAVEEALDNKRMHFETLSTLLIEVAKTKEMGDALFVQYCPMAFDNKGASWLSTSKEIRNPYYGDKMLKCGRVTAEL